jgi:phosphoenolpyruvate---glycerone phosphotransferase subunit DhaK
MKKLINNPEDFTREGLEGMALAHSSMIKINFNPTFVFRSDAPVKDKVAVISGGGSGHEPMHTGYVGKGMLDAACPGEVFTSSTPDQMLEAARTVNSGAGVLNIVKNYSGDVMSFEMATEMASLEGIHVANIVIDDDVAVKDSLFTQGRRGVGLTVLAEKICGAAAEGGYDLKHITDLGRRVNSAGRSMGIALTSCTIPTRGKPTFEIGNEDMEVGIGIHGEPGRYRKPIARADEITEMLALSIIEDKPYNRLLREWNEVNNEWIDIELTNPQFMPSDRVLAFVNGMGGTPISELYIIYRKLVEICQKKDLKIIRNLVGSYITALDMQGCSITLLRMDDEMIRLWDAPVFTPSLRWGI